MAYGDRKVRNPYETGALGQQLPAPPSSGMPIGPGMSTAKVPAPTPQRIQAPPRMPAPPPRAMPQNPYQTTPAPAPAPTPTPSPSPVPAPQPTPQPQGGQATFTASPTQAGGLSGYGQGGVWSSSVVTQNGGGVPTTPTPTTGGAGPTPKPVIPPNMTDEFIDAGGGVRAFNPMYASPDALWVIQQMKNAGVEFTPSNKQVQEMIRGGVDRNTLLSHYMSLVKQGGDAQGYGASMAGHGANYITNADVRSRLARGMGIGQTGWNAGDTGPVSDARRAFINRMRGSRGMGALSDTWGTPGGGGDVVTGGAPEPVAEPPNTNYGDLGGRGPNPSPGENPGGNLFPNRPKPYTGPGGLGDATPWNPYTPPTGGGSSRQLLGAPVGGGVTTAPPPPPGETEEPPPRRTPRGGVTQNWLPPGLVDLLYNLYGSLT